MRLSASPGLRPHLIILAIACGLYYEATRIRPVDGGQLGADFWPKAIILMAIITCVLEIVRGLHAGRPSAAPPETAIGVSIPTPAPDSPQAMAGCGRFTPCVGIGLTVAYALCLSTLGYFLSTFLYVCAFIYFGNLRRAGIAVCTALVASLAFMFIFMKVVYVSLPIGVEPFARVSTSIMSVMGVR